MSISYDYNAQANRFLLDAAKAGNSNGIKGALLAGADPNVREKKDGSRHNQNEGATPIQYACWTGPDALDGVKALIDARADLTGALWQAAVGSARYDNYEKDAAPLIEALIKAGADPNDASNGASPLYGCVNEYDAKISLSATKALLAHGANPNVNSPNLGNLLTRFVWSAKRGDNFGVEAVKSLVDAGAEINPHITERKYHSQAPLGAAVEGSGSNALVLIDYLISKGADLTVISTDGKTLLDIAKRDDIRTKLQNETSAPGRPETLSSSRLGQYEPNGLKDGPV